MPARAKRVSSGESDLAERVLAKSRELAAYVDALARFKRDWLNAIKDSIHGRRSEYKRLCARILSSYLDRLQRSPFYIIEWNRTLVIAEAPVMRGDRIYIKYHSSYGKLYEEMIVVDCIDAILNLLAKGMNQEASRLAQEAAALARRYGGRLYMYYRLMETLLKNKRVRTVHIPQRRARSMDIVDARHSIWTITGWVPRSNGAIIEYRRSSMSVERLRLYHARGSLCMITYDATQGELIVTNCDNAELEKALEKLGEAERFLRTAAAFTHRLMVLGRILA